MKAKISYTVDLDDIPQEVMKMLELPKDILYNLSKQSLAVSKETIYKTINQIEEMRKNLILVDARLSECQSILVGYNIELSKEKLHSHQTSEHSQELENINDSQ